MAKSLAPPGWKESVQNAIDKIKDREDAEKAAAAASAAAAKKAEAAAAAAAADAKNNSSSSSGLTVSYDDSGSKVLVDQYGNTSDYTVEYHSSEHVNTSTGSSINKNVLNNAIKNGTAAVNTIHVKNESGQIISTYKGYVFNNVTYTANGDRILEGGNANQSGLVNDYTDIERNIKEGWTVVTIKTPDPYKPPTNPYSPQEDTYDPPYVPPYVPPETIITPNDPVPPYIPPPKPPEYLNKPNPPALPEYPPGPNPPSLESFNVPAPTFASDLKRESRFIYFMGIDKIDVKSILSEETGIRVLENVDTDDAEWITLQTEHYVSEKSSIEYSILDNGKEYPILQNDETIVLNERLFPNIPTRFEMVGDPIEIRKNGEVINISLATAKNNRDGIYSVTYNSKEANTHIPKSNKIALKIVIRRYEEDSDLPYVAKAQFKMHGGGRVLWQENI